MRNRECAVKILSKKGRLYQTYLRKKEGWVQILPDGTVRSCTAEQLLSHMLPSLAGVSPSKVKVERDERPRTKQGSTRT